MASNHLDTGNFRGPHLSQVFKTGPLQKHVPNFPYVSDARCQSTDVSLPSLTLFILNPLYYIEFMLATKSRQCRGG